MEKYTNKKVRLGLKKISIIVAVFYAALFVNSALAAQAEPAVKLNYQPHKQAYSLSCEIAALKIALSVQGTDVPESEILKYLPFDKTAKRSGVWGDPYKAFVGNINGQMMVSGYGVYWQPIADIGSRWRRTEVIENGTLEQLVSYLNNGQPVIIWGYIGSGQQTSWITPEGKNINAVYGEHARVLIGYSGSSSDPSGYFVVDPIYGELYWDKNYFMKQWDSLGRAGVVVYEYPRWIKTEDHYMVWEISQDGKTKRALAMPWEEFAKMGGSLNAIKVINAADLEKYKTGIAYCAKDKACNV
ncbi:MAG: C39 family peptidase [Candidatus Portnoybacteria bacterium]|nr:C39 family peptidase [Candidatus Portnoybacteria bacterium]